MKSKIYKTMPKYMQRKAQRVTKLINEWDKAGLTSNDLEMSKEMLSNFYEFIGKTPKDTQKASDRLKLKKSEKEEYNKILDFILYNDEVDLSKRRLKNQQIRDMWEAQGFNTDTYEKVKSQYSQVYDEQSFIKFTDRMNMSKSDKFLKWVFSSDQIAQLYAGAYKARMKEYEIDRYISEEYKQMQQTQEKLWKNNEQEAREALYERVLGIIADKEKTYLEEHPKARRRK